MYQHRVEELVAVGSRGLLFELVLECQREALLERFIPRAVVTAQQRRANDAERVRLRRTITRFARERQSASSKIQSFLVPTPVRGQRGASAVRHRERSARRKRFEQRNRARHTLVGPPLVPYRPIFLGDEAQHTGLRLDVSKLTPACDGCRGRADGSGRLIRQTGFLRVEFGELCAYRQRQ